MSITTQYQRGREMWDWRDGSYRIFWSRPLDLGPNGEIPFPCNLGWRYLRGRATISGEPETFIQTTIPVLAHSETVLKDLLEKPRLPGRSILEDARKALADIPIEQEETFADYFWNRCLNDSKIMEILDDMEIRADGGGQRKDEGKPRVDLIPPDAMLELGKVYAAGARKYDERNWERGMPWSKVVGPLWRHLLKWMMGHEVDACSPDCPEDCKDHTNQLHIAIVAWNAFALLTYTLRKIGTDDRNKFAGESGGYIAVGPESVKALKKIREACEDQIDRRKIDE